MKRITLLSLLVVLLPTAPLHAIDIRADQGAVVVSPSQSKIGDQLVTVTQAATLTVAPAPVFNVENEKLKLSPEKPAGWAKGTRLKACLAKGSVSAYRSFLPGSLTIRRTKDGEPLKEGEDYVLDAEWGHVGLGPQSHVTAQDTVLANYRYSFTRVDTIQVSQDGKPSLKQGKPHLTLPVPPEADPGNVAVAHVFVDYGDTKVTPDRIYPILETAAEAVTGTTPGRIPKTLEKLKAGRPVTIVCWGDSVTVGGDASQPEFRYVDVFAAGLRTRFPQAKIDVQNISAGGSNSSQWLWPDRFPFRGLKGSENPARFERLIEAKPDLVTIEFVNDAGLTPERVESQYSEILKRLEPLGTEVVLITPHFTMWRMMRFTTMREAEKRPYVLGLRAFADKHHVALADASARWEHLAREGLPYLTLLHNSINHPDDRGHRLFAEELWKCFR